MFDIRQDRPRSKPFRGAGGTLATIWTPVNLIPSSATLAMSANSLYFVLFNLPGLSVNRIVAETTVGAGNARFGLYSNVNGEPGALICDSGVVDISGIAVFTTAIPEIVLPEYVWAAAAFSSTPTVRAGGAGNTQALGVDALTSARRGFSQTHAFAALPSGPGTLVFNNSAPLLGLQKV
jgi:hypothetical protein